MLSLPSHVYSCMSSAALFTVVSVAFGATLTLYSYHPLVFYVWCMGLQVATLVGIAINSVVLVQLGHVTFALLLYVGSFTLPYPDLWLVYVLCGTALVTRRVFNGCLFDLTTHCDFTHTVVADVFYSIPILVGVFLPHDVY